VRVPPLLVEVVEDRVIDFEASHSYRIMKAIYCHVPHVFAISTAGIDM
jgi:hypothetical protein